MEIRSIKTGIVTASDRGSRREREDKSGEVIKTEVEGIGGRVVAYEVVPDDLYILKETLIEFCDLRKLDLIFTTGGTGFSARDITPEATREVIEKEAPGLAEAMRAGSLRKTPRAMLSRAVAGIRGSTLIINLPGSPRAVRECLEVILPVLPHAIEILRGSCKDCGKNGM